MTNNEESFVEFGTRYAKKYSSKDINSKQQEKQNAIQYAGI